MAIFNSYVKLPEGSPQLNQQYTKIPPRSPHGNLSFGFSAPVDPRTRNNCTPMAKGPEITRHDSSSIPSSCLRWDKSWLCQELLISPTPRSFPVASSNNDVLGCVYANIRDPTVLKNISSGWDGETTSQFRSQTVDLANAGWHWSKEAWIWDPTWPEKSYWEDLLIWRFQQIVSPKEQSFTIGYHHLPLFLSRMLLSYPFCWLLWHAIMKLSHSPFTFSIFLRCSFWQGTEHHPAASTHRLPACCSEHWLGSFTCHTSRLGNTQSVGAIPSRWLTSICQYIYI